MLDNLYDLGLKLFKNVSHTLFFKLPLKIGLSDANKRDINGKTRLMSAAEEGDTETVLWLVETANAKVDLQDFDGYSALHRAAERGQLNTVRWLIKEGKAEVNAKTENGLTPIECLCSSIGKFNIRYQPLDIYWRTYMYLLSLEAVRKNNPDIGRSLALNDNVLLNLAIENQDRETVMVLLKYADVVDKITVTTLALARQYNLPDIECLLFASQKIARDQNKNSQNEKKALPVLNSFKGKPAESSALGKETKEVSKLDFPPALSPL